MKSKAKKTKGPWLHYTCCVTKGQTSIVKQDSGCCLTSRREIVAM